jgi:ATP-binding cassette, subfamily B, multidrug efflux pump
MLTRLTRTYLRSRKGPVALVVVLLVAQTIGNLYLPNLNAAIINNGVVTGNLHYILAVGGLMLVITLAIGGVAMVAVYWASRIAMGAGADIRSDLFRTVQSFSARDMNEFGTPSLITRNTNDVQQIQIFLQMALTMMVIAPIMSVGGMIFAIKEDARLLPLLAVAVPIMAGFLAVVMVKVVPQFRSMQVKIDRLNQILREQITGVRVIRAFVRGDAEVERFKVANVDLTATALSVNRTFALMPAWMMGILNLSSVAVLWFGGRFATQGTLPIGNLTAFLTYILQILISVMMAAMLVILLPRAMASAERIVEVLDTKPVVIDPPEARQPSALTGRVRFEDVSFSFAGSERPVLEGVTFSLAPGETSALIGGTGSGKSTLLSLIPRLFDVSSGIVTVNDVDVREQSQEGLWSSMGYVPQAAFLFSGTVASNLRLGRAEATDEELWRALEIAQARDFVAAMPGDLAAPIDQGGTNVSGGQRQRLAIARAIVKNPSLYLFDDCFSALDAGTDARLRSALREATRAATVLIVAQRVSTIMHAEHIIVLDDGRVVGEGTHASLLSTCEPYREIVVSQLGEDAA